MKSKNGRRMSEAERTAARAAAAEKRRALLNAEKSLNAEKRAEMLAAAGAIRTTDGAGLSSKNQVLIMMQAGALGFAPSLVGGFKQWREVGRSVRKGARGLSICFPMSRKNDETGADELAGFGWGYVFDISQTVKTGEDGEASDGGEAEQEQEQETQQKTEATQQAETATETATEAAAVPDDLAKLFADIAAA